MTHGEHDKHHKTTDNYRINYNKIFRKKEKAMITTKTKDAVILKNASGEYHFSHDAYSKLSPKEAEKIASEEITKKLSSSYVNKTINFSQARELGFCEYGIKDFAKMLELDIDKQYTIQFLNESLTIEALKEYPNECIKLFGKDTLKYLGGVKGILSEDTIYLVLRVDFIPEKTLHILSTKFAYQYIDIFEKEYPDDKRPQQAIEAKEAWVRGDITDEQLAAAGSAAWSAASSAASSAGSAGSAAWSAASSAASSAGSAGSAASSAASSAGSAARKKQVEIILEVL